MANENAEEQNPEKQWKEVWDNYPETVRSIESGNVMTQEQQKQALDYLILFMVIFAAVFSAGYMLNKMNV